MILGEEVRRRFVVKLTGVDLHELVLDSTAPVITLWVEVRFRLDRPRDFLLGLLPHALGLDKLILLVEVRQAEAVLKHIRRNLV